MRYRHTDSQPRKKRRFFGWLLLVLLLAALGLTGLAAIAPVALPMWHALHLSGFAAAVQAELAALAELEIVESSGEAEDAVEVVHALTVTIAEDILADMLRETLAEHPSPFLRVTSLRIRIIPNSILLDLNVMYTFREYAVFSTALATEWRIRTSPALLAAPMPTVVEVSPRLIRAAYWPEVDWIPFWQILARHRADGGWLPLECTIPLRLQDVLLDDGELLLSMAPGTFL